MLAIGENEMAKTTFIVCARQGRGFFIKKGVARPGIHSGKKMMEMVEDYESSRGSDRAGSASKAESFEGSGSLKKWLEKNRTEGDVVAVYLYHLTAPGEWCQIVWNTQNCMTADKTLKMLSSKLGDLCGDYIHGRTHLHNTVIAM